MEAVGPIVSNPDESVTPTSNGEFVLERELGQLMRELEAMTQQRDICKQLLPSFQMTSLERKFHMIESLALAGSSHFHVREACPALDVSPSGFHAHRHKTQRVRRG